MLNLAGIDEALKMLAIKKRFRFNAHQVAYLSGNSDVKEVYNYLVSKEPYIIYRRYEIQCPDNLDATGSYSSEAEIPEEWMECRICGCEFIPDKEVRLIGCEAAGHGVDTDKTAATMAVGSEGVFHGMKSYFCQNEYGQIDPVYSISAGLDYPGIGPEHAYLHDIGRAEYVPVTDDEAVEAFEYLARTEGIICAIESAHAVAYAKKLVPTMGKDQIVVITISGRGDKDCAAIARYRGEDIHE